MTLPNPESLTRAFSDAFSAHDLDAIAALFAEDADFLTLTGAWAEGRAEITKTLRSEMAGAFARVKLVTGRTKIRQVFPGVAQVMQRFVLSGILHPDGSDAGRVGAVLSALLARQDGNWHVVSAAFTAEG
jgi:uncharacterized protein (TIGR02246 family)